MHGLAANYLSVSPVFNPVEYPLNSGARRLLAGLVQFSTSECVIWIVLALALDLILSLRRSACSASFEPSANSSSIPVRITADAAKIGGAM